MVAIKDSKHVADLVTIAEGISAAKESDKALWGLGRNVKKLADSLTSDENKEKLVGIESHDNALEVASTLYTLSEALMPTANYEFNAEDVSAKLALVKSQRYLGELNDQDVEVLNALEPILADYGKSNGSGTRAAKTIAEKIEGRPERVITSFPDDTKPSNRQGNTKHSEGNIPQAAFDHAKAKGRTVDADSIRTAAMSVVTGKEAEASAQGYTFTAA